jgi:hypothetical protein
MDGNPHRLWFERGGTCFDFLGVFPFSGRVFWPFDIAQPVFPFRIGGQWTEFCEGGLRAKFPMQNIRLNGG